ncbi:hypothetical protein Rrhod_2553 [Rhodococcus rhodnii LMG 5362]|uniref:Uncharacterized protein n=1 Tax=Rhodococcus rhodnii LMG 5362 TaxID=1273125 RepID=R7WLK8_9NOCA|nr:hypothetical protein Rrhod_2553 [Rhodococcus rhodnii LMG 5362]
MLAERATLPAAEWATYCALGRTGCSAPTSARVEVHRIVEY